MARARSETLVNAAARRPGGESRAHSPLLRGPGRWAVLGCVLVAAAPALAEGEIRTVVVGLQARRNVDEGLALAMSDVVQGEVIKDKGRQVFGRTDLQRVLEFESERQALGCDDDSCLAEMASALAADRIITGSMDKVGSSYFVVITEIDAQKVEPLGRVQRRLPLDEDQLIVGIQELSRELLKITRTSGGGPAPGLAAGTGATTGAVTPGPTPTDPAPGAGDAPTPTAVPQVGSIMVVTEPPGAEVLLYDKPMGATPLRLDELPAGTAELRVKMDEGDPVFVDVPVRAGTVTEVNAKIRVPDTVSEAERVRYEEQLSSHNRTYYSKLGVGGGLACCAAPAGLLIPGVIGTALGASGSGAEAAIGAGWFCGAVCCGACALGGLGVGLWGLLDGSDAPEEPRASDDLVHKIEVRPEGADPILFEVDAVDEPRPPKERPKKKKKKKRKKSRRDDDDDGYGDDGDDSDEGGYGDDEEADREASPDRGEDGDDPDPAADAADDAPRNDDADSGYDHGDSGYDHGEPADLEPEPSKAKRKKKKSKKRKQSSDDRSDDDGYGAVTPTRRARRVVTVQLSPVQPARLDAFRY